MIRRSSLLAAISMAAVLLVPSLASPQDAPPEPTPPAQTKAPEPPRRGTRPGDAQKVFVLDHVDVRQMAKLLSVFPAEISLSTELRAVSVSAAPAVVAAIEQTIKRLDVASPPAPSVILTGYVLEGLPQPAELSDLPQELVPVIGQLKQAAPYAGYRLVGTLLARASEDSNFEANSAGRRPTSSSDDQQLPAGSFGLQGRTGAIRSGPPRLVEVRSLRFKGDIPLPQATTEGKASAASQFYFKHVSTMTSADLKDGQTIVVGKPASGSTPGSDLLFVLSVRFED